MKRYSVPKFINTYLFRHLGVRLEKLERTFEGQRANLIRDLKPELIIDGGANIGQWASQVRKVNPALKIWSFEPLEESRKQLEKVSNRYRNEWEVFPFALGQKNETRYINIASNSQMSSSFFDSTIHSQIRPEITFDSQQEVEVISLDSLEHRLQEFKNIFLKLDVQGFELSVILGAVKILPKISMIELESSFTPLYEGETAHHELIVKIKELGFTVWCISTPSSEKSGRQFALDTLLIRSDLIEEVRS
jgi:FkbM family methyltransferase